MQAAALLATAGVLPSLRAAEGGLPQARATPLTSPAQSVPTPLSDA